MYSKEHQSDTMSDTSVKLCTLTIYDGDTLYFKCQDLAYNSWSFCKNHFEICKPCSLVDTDISTTIQPHDNTKAPSRIQCTHLFKRGPRRGVQCTVMCDATIGLCSKHKPIVAETNDTTMIVAETNDTTMIVAETNDTTMIVADTNDEWMVENINLLEEFHDYEIERISDMKRQLYMSNWDPEWGWGECKIVKPDMIIGVNKVSEETRKDMLVKHLEKQQKRSGKCDLDRCTHRRKQRSNDPDDVDLQCTTMTKAKPGENGSMLTLCAKHYPKKFKVQG